MGKRRRNRQGKRNRVEGVGENAERGDTASGGTASGDTTSGDTTSGDTARWVMVLVLVLVLDTNEKLGGGW